MSPQLFRLGTRGVSQKFSSLSSVLFSCVWASSPPRGIWHMILPSSCPTYFILISCFPHGSDGKESSCNLGDPGSITGLGRSLGEGYGNPLPYSCLEKPKIREPGYSPWGSKESDMIEIHWMSLSKAWQWLLKLELLDAKGKSRKFTK